GSVSEPSSSSSVSSSWSSLRMSPCSRSISGSSSIFSTPCVSIASTAPESASRHSRRTVIAARSRPPRRSRSSSKTFSISWVRAATEAKALVADPLGAVDDGVAAEDEVVGRRRKGHLQQVAGVEARDLFDSGRREPALSLRLEKPLQSRARGGAAVLGREAALAGALDHADV